MITNKTVLKLNRDPLIRMNSEDRISWLKKNTDLPKFLHARIKRWDNNKFTKFIDACISNDQIALMEIFN